MGMHIPTPTNITYNEKKNNLTEVVIEPCYPGYGTTIGNALRRVLLSSLPGSAVTAIKIDGIQHEYDAIDHVKEDIVEIMMNLKKLRLVSHSEEPLKLELSVKGEKIVTAADIKKDSQVEIVNTDLVIANITDKKGEFKAEITVEPGVGYNPVEDRAIDKQDIGTIQIDSIFSPVVNVGFNIELTRVGQRTDYEKIILDVVTDGTIKAKEAIDAAIVLLQEQFAALTEAEPGDDKKKTKKTKVKDEEEVVKDKTEEEEK